MYGMTRPFELYFLTHFLTWMGKTRFLGGQQKMLVHVQFNLQMVA